MSIFKRLFKRFIDIIVKLFFCEIVAHVCLKAMVTNAKSYNIIYKCLELLGCAYHLL